MDSIFTSHNKSTTTTTHNPQKHHQPSNSELLSSAKLMAEAAKATLNHETGKVDKGKVAGAAADLLAAAEHYGNLDQKSFGKHVEKAENYLHQYHSSHSTTHTTTTTTSSGGHSATTTTHSSSHSGDDDGHSGGGYGEYFKMAEGFLKKH